jgi:two-component system phosphate regulon response regulator PhoB
MPLTLASERTKHQPSIKLGRVLVVEDEGLIAETITLALKDEGYDVVTATDGRAALELIHQLKELESNGGSGLTSTLPHQLRGRSLDLIILDLMLPYINGLDLCRWEQMITSRNRLAFANWLPVVVRCCVVTNSFKCSQSSPR